MIDVTDLLSRLGVDYTRRGSKVFARCPNPDHHDRSASWMIRDEPGEPRHGTHRCLACDYRGGPADLVMTVLSIPYRDAMDFIASSQQRSPLALDIAVEVRSRKSHDVLTPREIAFAPLWDWPTVYREYLDAREVDHLQVERWGIGYCQEGRLRGRIWIPARDRFGGLRGWTARTVANKHDKYISASLKDGAEPRVLFGEVHWPVEHGEETLYLCEGPFDALALDRQGFAVGALRGSDLDPGQAAKLIGWRNIVVVMDPDAAGEKAAQLFQGLRRWCDVSYVVLPEGSDVAKLAVDNRQELLQRLASPVPHYRRHQG